MTEREREEVEFEVYQDAILSLLETFGLDRDEAGLDPLKNLVAMNAYTLRLRERWLKGIDGDEEF